MIGTELVKLERVFTFIQIYLFEPGASILMPLDFNKKSSLTYAINIPASNSIY